MEPSTVDEMNAWHYGSSTNYQDMEHNWLKLCVLKNSFFVVAKLLACCSYSCGRASTIYREGSDGTIEPGNDAGGNGPSDTVAKRTVPRTARSHRPGHTNQMFP